MASADPYLWCALSVAQTSLKNLNFQSTDILLEGWTNTGPIQEEGVLKNLSEPTISQPIGLFSLQQFPHEVSCFEILDDLHVFARDACLDIVFGRMVAEGGFTSDQFVDEDAQGVMIHLIVVGLREENLRGHRVKCTADTRCTFLLDTFGEPKIDDCHMPTTVEDDVVSFQISIHESLRMHVLKSLGDLHSIS